MKIHIAVSNASLSPIKTALEQTFDTSADLEVVQEAGSADIVASDDVATVIEALKRGQLGAYLCLDQSKQMPTEGLSETYGDKFARFSLFDDAVPSTIMPGMMIWIQAHL